MRTFFAFILLLAPVGLVGCGGGDGAEVTGTVTIKDKPLSGAEVAFASTADPDQPNFFYGHTRADGTYKLVTPPGKGIPAGTYQVTVTWHVQLDGKPFPTGAEGDAAEAIELAKQEGQALERQAILKKEVGPDDNTIPLDLSKVKITTRRSQSDDGANTGF